MIILNLLFSLLCLPGAYDLNSSSLFSAVVTGSFKLSHTTSFRQYLPLDIRPYFTFMLLLKNVRS